jgi:hypothetical protein
MTALRSSTFRRNLQYCVSSPHILHKFTGALGVTVTCVSNNTVDLSNDDRRKNRMRTSPSRGSKSALVGHGNHKLRLTGFAVGNITHQQTDAGAW